MKAAFIGFLLAVTASLAAEWQTLFNGKDLDGWMTTPFGGAGEVEVQDGTLILNQGILTGVTYTNKFPTSDYEVEWEARRELGNDFFSALTFPVKESFATLVLGGWGGAVVGISSLDGSDASQNETTTHRRFEKGRWYKFRLRVTDNNLSAWIDADQAVNADIRGKTVSLRPGEIELSKPFGLAAWSTTGWIRGLRFRRLEAAEVAAVPAPKNLPSLPADLAAAADRIVFAATNSSVAYQRLAEMCDTFGPRFSGSTNLEGAIDWILTQMQRDGLANVHGEPISVPAWHRGVESVELLEPRQEGLPVLGLGGSIGTPEQGITAPVLVVTNFVELADRSGEARGKIVVFNAAFTEYGETVRFRYSGAIEAAKAGALASLIRSVTPFSLKTPHTGMMAYATNHPPIPHAALAPEDAERLARWQARGITPVVRLKMSAKTLPPSQSRNVIAELVGREHPEEVVVVGGHIDSWDVGQGAQDDGGNCIAAWEALRLLKSLDLQPRRTIRVVLWTNEENGAAGARGYRDAHRSEASNHVVAIEADSGVFAPAGYGFSGSEAGGKLVRTIGSYLARHLSAGEITLGAGDTDIAPLMELGVPTLGLRLKRNNYFWYHHTAADTVDKVSPTELNRITASLAVMIFSLAENELRLPR
jgi:carboxypeptidase Q